MSVIHTKPNYFHGFKSSTAIVLGACIIALGTGYSGTAVAQGASDDLLQFLPNSERFLGERATKGDEFLEPKHGPAHIYDSAVRTNGEHTPRSFTPTSQHATDLTYTRVEQSSAIETMYSTRIVDQIQQYGYDIFETTAYNSVNTHTARTNGVGAVQYNKNARQYNTHTSLENIPMGSVQDDFVLGVGDQLSITFTGQRAEQDTYKISPQGTVQILDFPPINAAGRTLGDFKKHVNAAAQNLHNTQGFVSLAHIRQIGVLVIGHVYQPGKKRLSAFHTVLDALSDAGGINKSGSLRQIKLVRDGRSTIIDLYGLLMHGTDHMDFNLRDGDRIIVPPIGPTIGIAGEVKRPGIYEILPILRGMHTSGSTRSERLSLNEVLNFSGGTLSPGKNRYIKMNINAGGQDMVRDVEDHLTPSFGDNAILMVSKGQAKRAGMVELSGHTRRPGIYALDEYKTLASILPSSDVLDADIYPLIGVIERWDEEQLAHKLISFPLRLVLKSQYDQRLEDGDVVHLFSNTQITALHNEPAGNAIGTIVEEGSTDEKNLNHARITNTIMANFLRERSAFLRGAVRNPGPYPVDEQVSLDSLLAVAGGLSLEANTHNIEITSDVIQSPDEEGNKARRSTQRSHIDFQHDNPKLVMVGPGDSVRVNQKFKKIEDKSVLIMGEVPNPGRYDLLPGDTLSDLLDRAGGYTAQAYPPGAIFSRESERRAEQARFKSQARQIKRAVATALEMDDEKVGPAKIAEARALAGELEDIQGVGRITVEADLGKLDTTPELDILLESGDRIFVPKRTLTVRVMGEVLSPAALQFREGKDPLNYISEAGGFSFHADKDRAFVLYPDGSAQPLRVSAWNHTAHFIPPGSTIVIPRDPEPFDFIQSAKDISQILSNLAITTIFIDDVTNGK